ncbi:MAG: adenine DNA glycosylase [Gammaproteobacteria bacterium]|nr:MAG: adenine DNA glycosylase [Gammaproteobacteria bacterium]
MSNAGLAAARAPEPAALAPALLDWWQRHGRKDLPWQDSPTPYRVWVSEIMLQQTQVTTVLRYYPRFLKAFPDIHKLAAAPLDEVLHHWSGLGYYARARNLHRAAGIVCTEHGGELPATLDELMALPGIGRSTAGAILALAGGQRQPILDGNAKRVLARCFAVTGWPGQAAVARRLWQLAEACTPADNVAQYTQAIMDLGATICRRERPQCERCPLAGCCLALQTGQVAALPGRRPQRARPLRRVTAVIVRRSSDGAVLLQKRPADGIWGGLWGLPELADAADLPEWCQRRFGRRPSRVETRPVYRHAFTHFELDIEPAIVQLPRTANCMEADGWLWYKLDAPAEVGLAAPVSRLLQALGDIA